MRAKTVAMISIAVIVGTQLLRGPSLSAETGQERVVRLAELEIDSAHLESYKAALQEEIATSIRVEPGVLTLYAVSVKDHPTQIRLFEIYANADAYETHLQSPHFKKYKSGTSGIVKSISSLKPSPSFWERSD
jgi:quinol monooxygenase YgiN